MTSTATHARPAYRAFRVRVARRQALTPHFTRITFAGDDLADFGTAGFDQRVKVVLPLPDSGFAHFPDCDDWYTAASRRSSSPATRRQRPPSVPSSSPCPSTRRASR